MVYETHRRFRHLVAELELNSKLSHIKSDRYFQQVQQNQAHARLKEVYRIMKLESDPNYQVSEYM